MICPALPVVVGIFWTSLTTAVYPGTVAGVIFPLISSFWIVSPSKTTFCCVVDATTFTLMSIWLLNFLPPTVWVTGTFRVPLFSFTAAVE